MSRNDLLEQRLGRRAVHQSHSSTISEYAGRHGDIDSLLPGLVQLVMPVTSQRCLHQRSTIKILNIDFVVVLVDVVLVAACSL